MKLSLIAPAVLALLGLLALDVSPAMGESASKPHKIPFHGKLQAVDTSADTITIEGKTPRVFHLTSTTKITDGAGDASTLSAATVGEDVGGSYTKDASGTMTLFSVRFGAKVAKTGATTTSETTTTAPTPPPATPSPAAPNTPPPAPTPAPTATTETPAATTTAATKATKQRFTGTVVSVSGDTIVVHGKADATYTATTTTKITDASKKATTLASFTPGEKVSGTYTKGDDGSMTLATLKASK